MAGEQHLDLPHRNQSPLIHCQASLDSPETHLVSTGEDFHVFALIQITLQGSRLWEPLSPGFSLPSPVTAQRLDLWGMEWLSGLRSSDACLLAEFCQVATRLQSAVYEKVS